MDMFTGDMEAWLHHVEVDDIRHAAMLRDMLSERDFSAHDTSSNVRYAFEMTKWIADHYQYLTYAGSESIDGNVMPTSLKSLIARDWAPAGELQVVYPSGSELSLKRQTIIYDHQQPTTLEKIIGQLITEGRSFEQVVADAKAFSELDEDLVVEQQQKKLNTGSAVEVFTLSWAHPLSINSGIDILARDTDIQAVPYGTSGNTNKLFGFCNELNKNPAELASMLSELGVLAAEHCLPRKKGYFTDRLDIENFATRLKTI